MAHWKRLTGVDDAMVDVNMDSVAYMQAYGDQTAIYFVGGRSDEGRISVHVKETPDAIHLAPPLRSS